MIKFEVKEVSNGTATLITFEIEGGVTTPEEAFGVELPKVPLDRGVIISGRGPIWLYARLMHHYHPSRWIAIHDPRIGFLVVASHCKERYEGEIIPA